MGFFFQSHDIYAVKVGNAFLYLIDILNMNVYYRPPDGGRLVPSVDAFLRSYFVTLKESNNDANVQFAGF